MVAGDQGWGSDCLQEEDTRELLELMEMFKSGIVVMVAQISEFIKNH